MYLIPIMLFIVGLFVYELIAVKKNKRVWVWPIVASCIGIFITFIVVGIDYNIQVSDEEIWSGSITEINHTEEYDEWHEGYRDSEGNWHEGYTEHHYASNTIKTSDGGLFYVNESPNRKEFNDSWPNTTMELTQYWKIGDPTASVHMYKNYVQSSYSIYKHQEINLDNYPGLPEYPNKTRNDIYIDRFVGNIPNKDAVLHKISDWNTKLNKSIPDPDKPGKTRSWKQVNLIFVNLGDVSEDWGFALQDNWENGNKNDFIISFATDGDYNVKWVYPFSWADTQNSELLKIKVREYIMSKGHMSDFIPIVDGVASLTSELFERKQMAEFSYINIETSFVGNFILWVILALSGISYPFLRIYSH
jgi:hypothetical protein